MRSDIRRLFPLALCTVLLSSAFVRRAQVEHVEQVLDAAMHHLGNDETPEWTEAPALPEGSSLELTFESQANPGEWTLAFSQRNVNDTWRVAINDVEIALCRPSEGLLECFFPVPAGTLVEGVNRFTLTSEQRGDDITFGRIRLLPESFREALDLCALEVRVVEAGTREPVPARVTIQRADGVLPPLFFADGLHQAARDGVVYSDHGVALLEVAAGEYEVFAARGPEWGLARSPVTLEPSALGAAPRSVTLTIEREVDPGRAVSVDTHIHTLTFSGHGDASVEERLVTLAGEGLDVAISTDHNHNTDYRPYQQRMGLEQEFLTIVGNEVTTPIGHFNAFPLDPAEGVPPHELHDVVELVEGMRSRGAQTVILNHPRWPDAERGPFGVIELNHFTGGGNGTLFAEYPFDAMELVNSCTDQDDPLLLFRDWFSLLNRGERVFAVGSSDSHTVGEPVGGGRTYVHGARGVGGAGANPQGIDVAALCAALREGRTSISMGLYVDTVVVAGAFDATAAPPASSSIGSTLTLAEGGVVTARVEIQAPSWARAKRALLFANGVEVAALELAPPDQGPARLTREVTLTDEHGGQDAWLVWVVLGDGVQTPHWPLLNDYTLAATNPVFLDWSGDGIYQSPRETAARLIDEHGLHAASLLPELRSAWPAVRRHALDLARVQFEREAGERLREFGLEAGEPRPSLEELLESFAE